MRRYRCSACGGICDPGELVGAVCDECREESARRTERILRVCREVREQKDGQMALEVANGT